MKLPEALLASVAAVFAPIKMVIVTTLLLILVDLVSGILAARKKGEVITSAGFRRSVTKLLVYLTAICLGFLVETYMIDNFIAVSKLVSGVIALTEIKSVLENLDVLNGSSLFKSILTKLGSDNDKKKD